ncbi:CARDB domain-containing protein [Baekduia sp. Peel2402]|uniref:CARDB domain-containing protein n=1 Tax=Baekduia sp. Peel2402 TaxID=3458296 RepID=UPI00403ECA80
MHRSVRLSLATLTLAAAAACAAPAGATTYSGSGTDPAGDGPAPARDIASVEAAYDDAGTVSASLTFGADPDPLFFYLQVGSLSGPTCGPPFAALGGYTDATSGVWGLSGDADGDLQSDARITRAGSKVTITATSSRLSGGAPNCVTGQVSTKDGQTLYDSVNTPAGLTAQVAPPTTTTTTTPAPPPPAATTPAPAPAPTPAPTQQTVAASAPKKVAQLAVTVSGVPSEIKRNHTMSLKVKVANTGTAAATGVKLMVGAARGLSATPKAITVKTLKAGKSTTRRVKVNLTKKAKTTTTLTLKASGAKKVAATGRVALRIGKAKKTTKKSPPVTTTPSKQNPLIGTYWWYVINHVDWAWDNHGVYFINDGWAYRGIPKGGLPVSCTTQTAGVDEKGNATDGCIPYTYDPATGAVTLGTVAGTFKDGKLQITDEGDLQDYDRLVVPEAGARYGVELVHRGFQGMCGLILGCTTWENWLTLAADGQFIYSKSTTTTMGDPGIGPFTAAGSYPPDEHGTYEVLAGGKIRLAFADGTVKEHTFAIQTDKAGNPDPGGEGVFLDEDNFYKDEMP